MLFKIGVGNVRASPMALFIPGKSECPICHKVLTDEDEVFGTWGVFSVDPALFPNCDAVIHWSCYADWPRRPEFARAYFNFWVKDEPHNQYWAKAFLDDQVFVTVNPFLGAAGEAELVFAATGSRIRVRIDEWERWLDNPETSEGERLHPLEIAELYRVAAALKSTFPTADAVMDALDGDPSRLVTRIREPTMPGFCSTNSATFIPGIGQQP
jgi:hypothetical protein